ncbi:hypothetical protein [Micromonospora sp. DPT]|uniref:hypothetical protein n=1 Tax=Micromonospora sp. DPT TaxID=3142975 RepID=UPI003207A463
MQLTAAHWVYLAGVVVIIATMIARKNIVVPAVVATFATALVFSHSDADFSGQILGTADPAKGPALLYDLVAAAQNHIPHSGFIVAFGILLIGMIAGLEGSGFSGLPLTGSLAGSLGPAAGISSETLAAGGPTPCSHGSQRSGSVGQMGNICSGGATLSWSSLIAVAGFARVPVIHLAHRCFIPVVSGLVVGTIFAVVFFP